MTASQADQVFQQKEISLRRTLRQKPRSAKAMSQLASLLEAYSRETGNENMKREAFALANQAIEIAPQKPFGYAALSSMEEDLPKRIGVLQKAIDLSKETYSVACIGLLVRLLVEPRDDEARRSRGKIGKASQNHPNRRNLNSSELELYNEIDSTLARVQGGESLSRNEKEFLAKNEYRLGLFFRKKDPPKIQKSRARKHLKNSLQQPTLNSDMARFWLATLSDDSTGKMQTKKCPQAYIVGLYSTFAERFDQLLVEKLGYQTPTKLRNLLNKSVNSTTKFKKGMDLGCGTGLSGLAFADFINTLHGVDLSPAMIEKARARNCYDHLQLDDVACALKNAAGSYDIVFACDVFCYIGDLAEVFGAVSQSLSKDGLFCFSTECLEETADSPYQLHSCARFSHKESYIRDLASQNGFQILNVEISALRKNQGGDVKGILVISKKELPPNLETEMVS
jgi:predicted TPR repeat methyltransferase